MSSTIVITPPPPDPGEEGLKARLAGKARITSMTIEVDDGASPQEAGHAVTEAFNIAQKFGA